MSISQQSQHQRTNTTCASFKPNEIKQKVDNWLTQGVSKNNLSENQLT